MTRSTSTALPVTGELTRLAVLGLLAYGPNHGYGLRSVMEDWRMHQWADIKLGSIYAALQRFERDNLVTPVETTSDHGPPRTSYRITDAGIAELRDLLEQAWTQPTRHVLSINIALTLLPLTWTLPEVITTATVQRLLADRIDVLEEGIHQLRSQRDTAIGSAPHTALAHLIRDHFNHGLDLATADLNWTRTILDALERGDYDPN